MKVLDSKTVDPTTALALRSFVERLSSRFRVGTAILFGSRARATAGQDSDTDVAVVLHGPRAKFIETTLAMTDIAYDVLLETGIHIQPLPIWQDEWEHPETHRNPRLLRNIERDGFSL